MLFLLCLVNELGWICNINDFGVCSVDDVLVWVEGWFFKVY